jgi:transcriptional regulator with XRE-family HTH domain
LRIDRGLTQEDLAHKAGITWAAYGRIERGESNPTWTTLQQIAEALDVSMTQLAALRDG